MAKIVIDAGHGGDNLGASYNGRNEKDDNLKLALAVGGILEKDGYEVSYTREEDIFDLPEEKVEKANKAGGDLFVSIHRNSGVTPDKYNGVQTLIYDESGKKVQLADKINKNLEGVGFNNIGISVRPDLVVLRDTNMPAVLVEVGFINSEKDNEIFDANFNEIAKQIASAINDVVPPKTQSVFYVQTGLYKNLSKQSENSNVHRKSRENKLKEQLLALGYPVESDEYKEYKRVKAGPYSSLNEAAAVERRLRTDGFSTLIIQE